MIASISSISYKNKAFKSQKLRNIKVAPIIYSIPILPTFNYLSGDKDPGVYVNFSQWLVSRGSLFIEYEVPYWLNGMRVDFTPGALFPGIWQISGEKNLYQSQFPEFWSACMSVFALLTEPGFGYILTSVIGIGSVITFYLILEKITSPIVTHFGTIIFVLNLTILWQFKFPSTESLSLLLMLLILREFVSNKENVSSRIIPLAGMMFCNRIDGIFVVLLLWPYVLIKISKNLNREKIVDLIKGGVFLGYGIYQTFILHPKYSEENFIISYHKLLMIFVFIALYSALFTKEKFQTVLTNPRNMSLIVSILLLAIVLRNILLYLLGWDLLGIGEKDDLYVIPILFILTLGIFPLGILYLLIYRNESIAIEIKTFIFLIAPLIVLQLTTSGVTPRLMWWGRRYAWLMIPLVIMLGLYSIFKIFKKKNETILVLLLTVVVASLLVSINLINFKEFDGLERQINAISKSIPSTNYVLVERNPCCMGPGWTLATPLFFTKNHKVVMVNKTDADALLKELENYQIDESLISFIFEKPEKGYRCIDFSVNVKRWDESFPQVPTNWRWVNNPAFVCKLIA